MNNSSRKPMILNTEDRWMIGSAILTLSGVGLAALLKDPRPIGISVFIIIAILLIAWLQTRNARLAWLLIFGFVAGAGELWADWIHVEYFHSLVYTDYFGFRVLASPLYMPFGWWLTVVQFGYLALRLTDRFRVITAIAFPTLMGALIPPWYEEFAAIAHAWHYVPYGTMLSHTPLWVIFTYACCTFSVASTSIILYRHQSWSRALLAGFFTSASFLFWSVFWFSLLR